MAREEKGESDEENTGDKRYGWHFSLNSSKREIIATNAKYAF